MTWPVASSAGPALASIQPPSSSSLTRTVRPLVRSKTKTSHSRLMSSAHSLPAAPGSPRGAARRPAAPRGLAQTRFAASDWNATKRPSPEIAGQALSPPADDPSAARLTQVRARCRGRRGRRRRHDCRRRRGGSTRRTRRRHVASVGADRRHRAVAVGAPGLPRRRHARRATADGVAQIDLSDAVLARSGRWPSVVVERSGRGKRDPSSVGAEARQDAVAAIGLNACDVDADAA